MSAADERCREVNQRCTDRGSPSSGIKDASLNRRDILGWQVARFRGVYEMEALPSGGRFDLNDDTAN